MMNAETSIAELIGEGFSLELLEPQLYAVTERGGAQTNEYDTAFGGVYDLVACSRLYNKLVWGYSIADYDTVCRAALDASQGWMLDAGCGSLAFTAATYAAGVRRPVVLLDLSMNLLRRARQRLSALCGGLPSNMAFVRGDVLRLPFRPTSFTTVLALNLLHTLSDPVPAVVELGRVLSGDGTLHCTTLVKTGRFADRYLARLGRANLLVPRSIEEVLACFAQAGIHYEHSISGSLATIHGRR
ncbi:MAG: class I SAM-dependent methyltransferase [Candidatus Binatia bacterium]